MTALYSDRELADWWARLSNAERDELFERIAERASSDVFRLQVLRWQDTHERDGLPASALQKLRGWADR